MDVKAKGVASVYAMALLDLARETNQEDALREELIELAKMLEADPGFRHFVTDPTIPTKAREAALEKMLRGHASDTLINGLLVMNAKGRLGIIEEVIAAFHDHYREAKNRLEVFVSSATALQGESREALGKVVQKLTGKEMELRETVDASLLGGLVVQFGDTQLDTSLARHLVRIRERLIDRGGREILGAGEQKYIQA